MSADNEACSLPLGKWLSGFALNRLISEVAAASRTASALIACHTRPLLVFLLLAFATTSIWPQPLILDKTVQHNPNATTTLNEQIPENFRKKYNRWKATFLASPVGERLWSLYAANPNFKLTIVMSKDRGRGASASDYQWEDGRLIAATISLGAKLDFGYPGDFYYPVLGSLLFRKNPLNESGDDLLAAAKLVHEFGHVAHAAEIGESSYRFQNVMSKAYVSKFMSNGRDLNDPVLDRLVGLTGGTPEEIFREREYWAETYALRFLLSRLDSGNRLRLLKMVRKTLNDDPKSLSMDCNKEWTSLTSLECENPTRQCW